MPRRRAEQPPGSPEDDLDEAAGELFALPPGDFTAARDAKARELRRSGNGPLAERIRALRRPTLAAWASNLLVRNHPDEVRGLLDLGEELRRAHQDFDGAQLRALSAQQRTLTMALARQARALTERAGQRISDQATVEVRETLQAALADPDAAAEWATGRLAHTLTPPAFPGLTASSDEAAEAPAPRETRPSASRQRTSHAQVSHLDQARARREARARLAEAQEAADRAARGLADLEAALKAAQDAEQAAVERKHHANERLADLRREIADAEQELHDATEDEHQAHQEARQAERALPTARKTATTTAAKAQHLAQEAKNPR
jgi:hypothetical protein